MDSGIHCCGSLQSEELQALSAIYGDDFIIVDSENSVYAIRITSDHFSSQDERVIVLQFRYPSGYPNSANLEYNIQAPWLRGSDLERLKMMLNTQASHEYPIVHLLVECINDFLTQPLQQQHGIPECESSSKCAPESAHCKHDSNDNPRNSHLEVFHGDPLIDRKSVFQAHCARINSAEQAKEFVSMLLEDRKVAVATHNIVAWRVVTTSKSGSEVVLADCDDDGETHAGSRLLHLLTLAKVKNVIVMVSRWYGGIQLGPDRFKHINNVARNLLVSHGLLGDELSTGDQKPKKGARSKRK